MAILSGEDKSTFLGCLFIAFIIWLLSALSETYTTEIQVSVSYKNLPEDKVLTRNLENTLYLTIKGAGSDLVKQMRFIKKSVVLDYAKYINTQRVSSATLFTQIEEQLSKLEVRDIKPDTLYFYLENKAQKKVPIKFEHNISTSTHFKLKNNLAITPDSVLVIGPKSVLDTLKNWKTEELVKRDVSQNFDGSIPLIPPNQTGLTIAPEQVNYFGEVEEFTEKRLLLPVLTKNLAKDQSVVLYPKNVQLQFQVGTSEFEVLDKDYFKIVADFSTIDINTAQEIPLKVIEQPTGIRNLRVSPEYAEFIVIEQ